jgi:hypothetical protein
MIRIDARHFDTRSHAQRLRDIRRSGTPDVFLRDDENRCGRALKLLGLFGNGGYLDVTELFKTELLQAARNRLAVHGLSPTTLERRDE